MSFGRALFDALDRVAGPPPRRAAYKATVESKAGLHQRLAYITDPRTGASVRRVAELAGVSRDTVRAWLAGREPTAASRAKIDAVYEQFRGINNRAYGAQKERQVFTAVSKDTLLVTNSLAASRYWKPAGRWPVLIRFWIDGDEAAADAEWQEIVDEWEESDPKPWQPEEITRIDIV